MAVNSYWVVPEDVKLHWGRLLPQFEAFASGHGNEQMTLGLIVRDGRVVEFVAPTYNRREPRGALDGQESRPWWSVIRRLQSVGNGRACLITVTINLDQHGLPASWCSPMVQPLETAN